MATLSFEGETHAELVAKVRRWLESVDDELDAPSITETVERASDLTKDALRIVAEAAPAPIRHRDVVTALVRMGHDATDATKKAVVTGLDALADERDDVLRRADGARRSAVYEMNAAVARQVLRALRP